MEVTGIMAIVFLASFTEGLVEYMFAGYEAVKPHLGKIALAIGIILAIGYDIDIPSMVGLVTDYGVLNNVVSGLIIGRGSNYVNDAISRIRGEFTPAVV